jgi:hypothetical protein
VIDRLILAVEWQEQDEPGPDHVPSRDRQTFPSYEIVSVSEHTLHKGTYSVEVGVESILPSMCLHGQWSSCASWS